MEHTLHTLAEKINSLGLKIPAILFLETCKPLSGLFGHAGEVVREIDGQINLTSTSYFQSFVSLLSSREKTEALIQLLEKDK